MKSESTETITMFWKIKNILDNAGHPIKVVKTERPGKKVYEDDYPVVAIPFSEQKIIARVCIGFFGDTDLIPKWRFLLCPKLL